jgi:hypothetical protein
MPVNYNCSTRGTSRTSRAPARYLTQRMCICVLLQRLLIHKSVHNLWTTSIVTDQHLGISLSFGSLHCTPIVGFLVLAEDRRNWSKLCREIAPIDASNFAASVTKSVRLMS